MDRWMHWEGKKVYVELSSGRKYTGVVKEVSDAGASRYFINIQDKFGHRVCFINTEIVVIQEESDSKIKIR